MTLHNWVRCDLYADGYVPVTGQTQSAQPNRIDLFVYWRLGSLTSSVITTLAVIHVSIHHTSLARRAYLSATFELASPFPLASHPAVSNDAVGVRLISLECDGRILAFIVIGHSKAHLSDLISIRYCGRFYLPQDSFDGGI